MDNSTYLNRIYQYRAFPSLKEHSLSSFENSHNDLHEEHPVSLSVRTRLYLHTSLESVLRHPHKQYYLVEDRSSTREEAIRWKRAHALTQCNSFTTGSIWEITNVVINIVRNSASNTPITSSIQKYEQEEEWNSCSSRIELTISNHNNDNHTNDNDSEQLKQQQEEDK